MKKLIFLCVFFLSTLSFGRNLDIITQQIIIIQEENQLIDVLSTRVRDSKDLKSASPYGTLISMEYLTNDAIARIDSILTKHKNRITRTQKKELIEIRKLLQKYKSSLKKLRTKLNKIYLFN